MTILDAGAALGPQLRPPGRADQRHVQTDPQLQNKHKPSGHRAVHSSLPATFLLATAERVSNPKLFVQRDGGANSARNNLQALVTQVQARSHCPPNPYAVLLVENQPYGFICAQTVERPLG